MYSLSFAESSEKNASVALVPYTEPVSFTIKAKDAKHVASEADSENIIDSEIVHNDRSKNSSPVLEESKVGHSLGKVADSLVAASSHVADNKLKGDGTGTR